MRIRSNFRLLTGCFVLAFAAALVSTVPQGRLANVGNLVPKPGRCVANNTPCARCIDLAGIAYCLFPPTTAAQGGCLEDSEVDGFCENVLQDCGQLKDCVTGAVQGGCGAERYCANS